MDITFSNTISPIDNRYFNLISELSNFYSYKSWTNYRLSVECKYLTLLLKVFDNNNIFHIQNKNNEDIGSDRVLRQYNMKRFHLTGSKVFGIHLLNKISMTENIFLRIARKNFLMYLNQSPLLKRTLIKAGLGK